MAVYLDEDYIGSDASVLVFPHLLLCLGIACQMSTGRLVGCHVSSADTEEAVLALFRAEIQRASGTPRRLYMIADFSAHFHHTKLSFTVKARKLGYVGNIFVLDTKPVIRTDGAYARIESFGGDVPCSVYIMADEDARPYTTVGGKGFDLGDSTLLRFDLSKRAPGDLGWIRTGDSAKRPGVPVAQNDFKIARVIDIRN